VQPKRRRAAAPKGHILAAVDTGLFSIKSQDMPMFLHYLGLNLIFFAILLFTY